MKTIRFTYHVSGCPNEGRRDFLIIPGECQECEEVEVRVPLKEALRCISKVIGKQVDEEELTEYVRQQNAPHN